ncbi:MAG: hypothetical protein JSW71_09185 [Gemmatimonadota bacterium]|nr:MAG: hypothetical protein JSW71_09185 [Gemmatimonadota bacterium]
MTSRYRVEQRRIKHRGREFRFVSYEGQTANIARGIPATEPAWFLVTDGYRWEAMTQQADQELDELDRMLREWLEACVFSGVAETSA